MINPLLGSELIKGLGAQPCLEKRNENFPVDFTAPVATRESWGPGEGGEDTRQG